MLYHNYITNSAFLHYQNIDKKKIDYILDELNNLEPHQENYFSKNFGGRYFSKEIAIKIGSIREKIEDMKNNITIQEKYILITSLIYGIDKIANTVGHYDAFIKKDIKSQKLELKLLEIDITKNQGNKIYNCDANQLIRKLECDILYLDPPYNSRQYSDAYHLLENLAHWEKPPVFGVAKKFDRNHIKSNYNKVSATKSFENLILNARTKHILLSYNNMENKGNNRSNAKMTDNDILRILGTRGEVKIFEKEFKEYNTGNKLRGQNMERVFFVKVEK